MCHTPVPASCSDPIPPLSQPQKTGCRICALHTEQQGGLTTEQSRPEQAVWKAHPEFNVTEIKSFSSRGPQVLVAKPDYASSGIKSLRFKTWNSFLPQPRLIKKHSPFQRLLCTYFSNKSIVWLFHYRLAIFFQRWREHSCGAVLGRQ